MSQQDKRPPYFWIGLTVITAAFIGLALLQRASSGPEEFLTPVSSFSDAHGLAVDVTDSSKVYIATHNGLYQLKDDKDLYRMGTVRDDLMGFSAHPTKPNVFFSGGHNGAMTANLGLQKSEDGGATWTKLGNGVGTRAVDFHALAIGQVNPDIIYGSAGGQLQRTTDGGKTWQFVESAPPQISTLAADSSERDTVYAGTAAGLMVSRDQGESWSGVSPQLRGAVSTIAVNPANNKELLAYSPETGLQKTADGGQSWTVIDSEFANSRIMYLSYDRTNPATIYGINSDLSVYKTTDGGTTWNKVR